jgi:hypothetical protein
MPSATTEPDDRDDATRAVQPLAVENCACVTHVAAIGATGHAEALRVEPRIRRQQIEEGANVAHRVLALEWAIIEAYE